MIRIMLIALLVVPLQVWGADTLIYKMTDADSVDCAHIEWHSFQDHTNWNYGGTDYTCYVGYSYGVPGGLRIEGNMVLRWPNLDEELDALWVTEVDSARVGLVVENDNVTGSDAMSLFAYNLLVAGWKEGTGGGSVQDSGVTWNMANDQDNADSVRWDVPGVGGDDISGTYEDSIYCVPATYDVGDTVWFDIAGATVEGWLTSNTGLLITHTYHAGSSTNYGLYTDDYYTTATIPFIYIFYGGGAAATGQVIMVTGG